jgi:hypothetical protein
MFTHSYIEQLGLLDSNDGRKKVLDFFGEDPKGTPELVLAAARGGWWVVGGPLIAGCVWCGVQCVRKWNGLRRAKRGWSDGTNSWRTSKISRRKHPK